MSDLTLTDQQLDALAGSQEAIAVRDERGKVRGYVTVLVTEAELADARRSLAAKQPRYTTAQVLATLQAKSAS